MIHREKITTIKLINTSIMSHRVCVCVCVCVFVWWEHFKHVVYNTLNATMTDAMFYNLSGNGHLIVYKNNNKKGARIYVARLSISFCILYNFELKSIQTFCTQTNYVLVHSNKYHSIVLYQLKWWKLCLNWPCWGSIFIIHMILFIIW